MAREIRMDLHTQWANLTHVPPVFIYLANRGVQWRVHASCWPDFLVREYFRDKPSAIALAESVMARFGGPDKFAAKRPGASQ